MKTRDGAPRRGLFGLVLAAALFAAPAHAQYREVPPPAAYALENVTVVAADGSTRAGMTVVIRAGLIEAMGQGIGVPADARVLEGENLHLYPGIVDAQGEAEMVWGDPRDVEDDDDVTSWAPPRSSQGFLPHRRVADAIDVFETDFESRRQASVVASLVHPGGGLAPGQPAVIVHRAAHAPWEVVENPSAGLTMAFQSAGGVYPSQLFGVIAVIRQAYMDAERYAAMRAAQTAAAPTFVPSGWDPDYEALLATTRGGSTVYFVADSDEDIRRALDLSDEFGFPIAIVGGAQAWKHADELARRSVPVHVSLDFPNPRDWDPDEDMAEAELSPDALREKEDLENRYANAGRLAEAGVTFTLTSGGGRADMLEGLAKVVEYGLSETDAVAAVTTTPARLLGVANLTRVAQGGPATFMVANGPILGGEEDASVRYTFVEGALTEGDAGGGGGGSGDAPAGNLSGTWAATLEAGGQEQTGTFEVSQDDEGRLSGTLSAAGMPASDFTGSISGREVSIEVEIPEAGITLELNGTLSEDGNTIRGSGDSPFGPINFELVRGGEQTLLRFLGGGR